MVRAHLEHCQTVLRAALRHPLAVVALPIAMLLVFRLGGEPGLIVAAFLVPVALGAIHLRRGEEQPEDPGALPGAGAFDASPAKVLRTEPRARTACLLVRPDHAARLAGDLPGAFEAGQVVAFFQPQICTDTGTLSGVEALARWHHPRHGLLAPGQFLKTVEAAGLTGALTETMLSNALEALGDWDRIGLAVPRVSVNFSLDDLSNPTLVERIAWMLDATGVAAERLGIEVLESVLNLDGDRAVSQTLWRLRELGCFIDLDDFGTGNTSIANIRRFAAQRLKIDRSFVGRVDRDADQRGMVAAILTMAEQLRLETLAEGVETPEEHATLSQLGCGHVQGFGIGHPMPGDRLPAWLAGRAQPAPPAILPETLKRPPPDVRALSLARARDKARPSPIKPLCPRRGQGKTA